MIARTDFEGDVNVGLFGVATDRFVFSLEWQLTASYS